MSDFVLGILITCIEVLQNTAERLRTVRVRFMYVHYMYVYSAPSVHMCSPLCTRTVYVRWHQCQFAVIIGRSTVCGYIAVSYSTPQEVIPL